MELLRNRISGWSYCAIGSVGGAIAQLGQWVGRAIAQSGRRMGGTIAQQGQRVELLRNRAFVIHESSRLEHTRKRKGKGEKKEP